MIVLAAALLAEPALALREKAAAGAIQQGHIISSEDCWKKAPVHTALTQLGQHLQKANTTNPGAGLGEIVPFETIQKDGYAKVTCVKDYMFTYGDKFGDNKHEYNQGDVSDVSIVHYAAIVPKEDRKSMTPTVCFDFCRTVPDMLYFGILNGRECYCTPFYKPMESDSSDCDATCEGEPTQMCGGKSKSTIWGMHMCANTVEDAKKVLAKSSDATDSLKDLYKRFDDIGVNGQMDAEEMQKVFGQAGDPVASDLMQAVKVQAGVLEKMAKDAGALIGEMEASSKKLMGMAGGDITSFKAVKAAEELMAEIEEQLLAAKETDAGMEEVLADHKKVMPESKDPPADVIDRKDLYYPVMYFVDKKHEEEMSTCGGETDGVPLMGLSMDECAVVCDSKVHSCVAFQYFSQGKGICVLFTKLTSITHYTGCEKVEGFGRFLQKTTSQKEDKPISCLDGMPLTAIPAEECDAAEDAGGFSPNCDAVGPGEYCECDGECGCNGSLNNCGWAEVYKKGGSKLFTAKCVAKFAKYDGLNLTPQGSGKCDICLKTVDQADRCYA
jgi:hypothetical protein